MTKINLDPLKTSSYDYSLPKEQIATYPVTPASDAKLLVYNKTTKEIIHTTYNNLLDYIPKNTNIFFNDTKVIKARIFGRKHTGGKVELLFNKPHINDTFMVYIRGKVRVGYELSFDNNLNVKIEELYADGIRIVSFYQDGKKLNFLEVVELLNEIGHIPLPHYLEREDEKSDDINYQTLFAKNYGAVAAPTASLHFTPELLNQLKEEFNTYYLTLHVGAGTFKPVECEDILDHPMHSEFYNIPEVSKEILNEQSKILAVGTTVTRTIEYYNDTKQNNGEANLFLNPSNKPKKVDYLLTNFHLPKSTLIMLVASFVGLKETLRIYDIAVKEKYRFFSYGDGMIII
ncbi:MAG TPA: tRNA preQ1(34) S-adenosylmethionine ribosyltransferase-isomerase QueA [Arcobacter sp.]|nr:tRNA preQ1(34) S-adenosylmethionine ribosyltransferase-isomerase QueA [Arcobacter sp.]HIP55612.1 tRNA preQ1(34) S-adenosylmethionine ribosyltransferase-isomerase QueA [Arcobacter sp.]